MAIATSLNLQVATALGQFDPSSQVVGGGFQVVPFVEQSAKLKVGRSDGRRPFSQLYRLPTQCRRLMQLTLRCLDWA